MNVDGAELMALRPALCRFVRRKMPSVDAATVDDLVSETMARTLASPKCLDSRPDALANWLYQVARNLTIDWYRQRRAETVELDRVDRERGCLDVGTDRHAERIDLEHAVRQLRPDHRRLIEAALTGDQTLTAAGRSIGFSKSMVCRRVVRARVALRLLLEVAP